MAFYDAPDTGTWNASQEEREKLRKENAEGNRQGLQNALNQSNQNAQNNSGGSSGDNLPGIYSPGYRGTTTQPKKPKTSGSGNKGGNMTLPPGYTPQQGAGGASREEEWFEPKQPKTYTPEPEAETTPGYNGKRPGAVGTGTGRKGGMPDMSIIPATEPEPEAETPKTPKAAEPETPVTYTPPATTAEATKNAADTAARTKEALTTEQDYMLDDWMRSRELRANEAQKQAEQAGRNMVQREVGEQYGPRYLNPPTPQREVDDQFGPRYLLNQGGTNGMNPGLRTTGTAAPVYNTYNIPGLRTTPQSLYGTPGAPVTPQLAGESGPNIPQTPNSNVRGEPTAVELAGQYGIPVTVLDDPQFQEAYNNLKAQGMTNGAALSSAYARYNGRQVDAENAAVNARVNQIESGMENITREQHDEIVRQVRQEIADVNAYAASKRAGYDYNPPRTSTAGYTPTSIYTPTSATPAATTGTNTNGRPGIDINAYGASRRAGYDYVPVQTGTSQNMVGLGRPSNGGTVGGAIDTTQLPAGTTGGTNNGGTTGGTTTGGTTTGANGAVPKGSKTYNPSYEQGGDVVKAPYKVGGYTAEEIEAMGNHPYGTKYGSKVYEGYYQAPNGNYYPVDQMKANYWRRNGGSYKGWQEGMRGYFNTYGTFYGYRPDWQTAGKGKKGGSGKGGSNNNNYQYRGGSNKGGSGNNNNNNNNNNHNGISYGVGSTPNNGLYWNGNTSWSI